MNDIMDIKQAIAQLSNETARSSLQFMLLL